MIKKTIKYNDYNGVEKVKDFYFHLSKVDMVEISLDGLFEKELQEALRVGDKLKIFRMFKKLISMSVGVRSEDGEDFARPEMFREAFMSGPAFDELIMELFTSEDQGTAFIRGLLPADMRENMQKEIDKQENGTKVDPFDETPIWERENRKPTTVELQSMTREQLQKAVGRALSAE